VRYYCPANSDLPKACNTPAATTCSSQGCTNPTCATVTVDPQEQTTLGKLLSRLGDLFEPELSVGLSVNIYWDVSAASFNGGDGFGIDIPLPFDFLPDISLLFNAPPFHCLDKSAYKLAGIGLSTPLKTSFPLRTSRASDESIRETVSRMATQSLEKAKNFKDNFDKYKQDVKEDKRTLLAGNSIGFGLGYGYDASFNKVEGRYNWSGVCGGGDSNPSPTTSSPPSKSPSQAPTVRIHITPCFVSVLPPCHILTTRLLFLMITHPLSALRRTQQPM